MDKKALLALVAALITAVAPAYAARTDIAVQIPLDPNVTFAAGTADLTWTSADVSNLNSFTMSGKEIVFCRNTHATNPYTVTLTSAPDALGRTKDIAAYSIAAGKVARFGPFATLGWRQSTGKFHLQGENASIQFAITREK